MEIQIHGALVDVGILVAWQLIGALFTPIWLFVVNLLYPGFQYG